MQTLTQVSGGKYLWLCNKLLPCLLVGIIFCGLILLWLVIAYIIILYTDNDQWTNVVLQCHPSIHIKPTSSSL